MACWQISAFVGQDYRIWYRNHIGEGFLDIREWFWVSSKLHLAFEKILFTHTFGKRANFIQYSVDGAICQQIFYTRLLQINWLEI